MRAKPAEGGGRVARIFVALLRIGFVILVAYPVVLVMLGLTIRHRARLPTKGPAVIAANHNSHLDTLALLTLFPLFRIPQVRPVAAADYFLGGGLKSWFSLNVVGIIPVMRRRIVPNEDPPRDEDPLADCYAALERGEILLIFPEGTRGEPEQMQSLKAGVSFIARRFPTVPIVPVFFYGLGRSMPKGTWYPLPVFVDVRVGPSLHWTGDKTVFMGHLRDAFERLAAPVRPKNQFDRRTEGNER
ncbi:MAG: lysophospholipid acyltransferase family protein [Burkholderiales bacterium]